jgi:protease YdgD
MKPRPKCALHAAPILAALLAAVLAVAAQAATPLRSTVLPGVNPEGHDKRVVVDGRAPPWTGVLLLQIPGVSRCTAFLIAPRLAVSAAHCLWGKRLGHFAPAQSVHVLTLYDRGGFAEHSVAKSFRIAAGYDPNRPDATRGADVAVITLQEALGTAANMLKLAGARAGEAAMLGGYNQDRVQVIEADSTCHVTGRARDGQGRVLLVHDCAGTRGTSGAPLLVPDTDGRWRAAGVQVGAFDAHAGGVAVPAGAIRALMK